MNEPPPPSGAPGHQPPPAPDSERPPVGSPAPESNLGLERGHVIGLGIREASDWALRLIIIGVALALLFWLVGKVWVGIFPILVALLLSSVLWPPVRWLRSKGIRPAAAALGVVFGAFLVMGGVMAAIAPSVASQSTDLAERATEGVQRVRDWLAGPPVNLNNEQITSLTDRVTEWLNSRADSIASGAFSGVFTLGSLLMTVLLVLVLTFFFLKDGPLFMPWLRRISGRSAGRHLTEVLTRIWTTLGGFVRTQAVVSAVDAVLIMIGLLILQVPLAVALGILTFFGGFIPIVGAVAVGALAVLVALVSNGLTVAIIVLAIILGVQQLEGNLLQPMLQSRSLELHAGVILLAVAGGGALFGIVGAFLAVPIAGALVVTLRYISEQVDLRTGDVSADELKVATPEGAAAAIQGQRAGRMLHVRHRAKVARQAQAHADDAADAARHRIRRRKRRDDADDPPPGQEPGTG